jgi:hypothetical protein
MKQYSARVGRPETNWNDILVSHAAKDDLSQIGKENNNYDSYIPDLKRWASSVEWLDFADQTGFQQRVRPYTMQEEGDFDPIEIYAYYIGLEINKMSRGNEIYTKYLLSYPATFDKILKDKLVESFKRGIIKSFPNCIAKDVSVLPRKFSVKLGSCEPAAYAVCALKEYALNSKDENDKIYFGVFDFGGGTTDFDYGSWRKASKEENENHEYENVIEHFGNAGQPALGGENILEELAYMVFMQKDNFELMKEKNIPFLCPKLDTEAVANELTIAGSPHAHFNMHILKEELRPLWEKTSEYPGKYEAGQLPVTLRNISGALVEEEIKLKIDADKLEERISMRIETGVDAFLQRLSEEMGLHKAPGRVNILLAGNSCKAKIVMDIFEKKKAEWETEKKKPGENLELKIFPPLDKSNTETNSENDNSVTGKTGVAKGLILATKDFHIRVINQDVENDGEAQFRYVVLKKGVNGPQIVIDFSAPLNSPWKRLLKASEEEITIRYSNEQTAKRDITKATIGHFSIPVINEDAWVWIRPVTPEEIEYTVAEAAASGKDETVGKPLFEPRRYNLREGREVQQIQSVNSMDKGE